VTPASPRILIGTDQPLTSLYDVALLDLDGVVYLGRDAIPGAAAALAKARAVGMRLAFVTNNASRDPATVAAHLVELGVPAVADDVVTSSQAAATMVVEHCGLGSVVLVIGTPALASTIEKAGLRVVGSADDRPDAVVQGYSPDLRYADLAEAALAVRAGAFWVATNTDSTLPSRRGLLPGNGSLVAAVATATGHRPAVAGKPALPLHAEVVRRTGARNPLVVGDRLDTDIEGAYAARSDSLLVLTGVAHAAELVNAPVQHRPTYLALDLGGLLEPHRRVKSDGLTARCGGWTAAVETAGGHSDIKLDGDGPAIDGLRAVLGAAWSWQPARGDGSATLSFVGGLQGVDAAAALSRLGFA
jgi:glycerol 3-phosphatase-2